MWNKIGKRQKHAAYVFGFIEEEKYEQVAYFKAPSKCTTKAKPFIYSEYKNTHLSDSKS